jgi:hypothetical protein
MAGGLAWDRRRNPISRERARVNGREGNETYKKLIIKMLEKLLGIFSGSVRRHFSCEKWRQKYKMYTNV